MVDLATHGEAAILDLLVKVLAEVVAAASAPLAAVDKMTVISTDGAGLLRRFPGTVAEQEREGTAELPEG